ncbi:MAG: hypothetical protein BWY33_01777 [Candidatus Dependentiae bacterium ADurb.Bin246]|nr:MAG: hypothetical protein BWY33_01777 [Candidatus Dependentiae bacterium ADurb.Bin246]
MARYLIKTVETYRVDTEDEVASFIEELKSNSSYDLVSYKSKRKEKKEKGEVIDTWCQVQVVKEIDDEVYPVNCICYGLKDGAKCGRASSEALDSYEDNESCKCEFDE